jgi:hypothetical protein
MRATGPARPLGVNRLEFRDDALETQVVGHIDSLNEDLSALDGLYRGLVEDMRHGAQNTAMLIANFNLRVPVCLSGLGMLNYELHGVRKRALCFLAVIPEQAQTKIIIGAEKEHQNAIDLHFMDETSPALVARLAGHRSVSEVIQPAIVGPGRQTTKSVSCLRITSNSSGTLRYQVNSRASRSNARNSST